MVSEKNIQPIRNKFCNILINGIFWIWFRNLLGILLNAKLITWKSVCVSFLLTALFDPQLAVLTRSSSLREEILSTLDVSLESRKYFRKCMLSLGL